MTEPFIDRARWLGVASLLLLVCAGLGGPPALASGNSPEATPLIVDTDMESDVDDVGALAMIHALADFGEIDLLGVMVVAKNHWSVLAADRINTHFGRPDLPLGRLTGEGVHRDSRYARAVAEQFPGTRSSVDEVPDAVSEYRRLLAAQPDDSVVVLTIGYLTNLRDLLKSDADEHSDLTGRDLVDRKVRTWVAMGGRFPDGGVESNIGRFDPEAARYVVENWPTEAHFADWDIGNIETGHSLLDLPESSPVRLAYEHFGQIPHRSWDQVATLYAVRGLDRGPASGWSLSQRGHVEIIPEDHYTDWHEGPPPDHYASGDQYYLIPTMDRADMVDSINALMAHIPAGEDPWGFRVSVDDRIPLTGSEVQVTAQLVDDAQRPVYEAGHGVHWSTRHGELSSSRSETDYRGRATVTLAVDDPVGTEHWVSVVQDADPAIRGDSPVVVTQGTDPAGRIAYFPLNRGTGDQAVDQSGFGAPIDLNFVGDVAWADNGRGVVFDGGRLESDGAAAKLYQRIQTTGRFTLEAWLRPAVTDQEGPARIVTFSQGSQHRNFTLGHGGHQAPGGDGVFRLRTRHTDDNGQPGVVASDLMDGSLKQVVVTVDADKVQVYRNGALAHTEPRAGALSNWDATYPLILGDEADGGRHWRGLLQSLAIYDRALDASEIEDRYTALTLATQ